MPNEEYFKWFSTRLDRDMEMLVYGTKGAPVIVCPTSTARFFEWKDSGMIEALADKIDAGFIQLYCVDSVGIESWYNEQIAPPARVARHNAWEAYLIEEALPFIRARNANEFLITVGASFGAFLAVNFALKHPDLVRKAVGLSGSYSIRQLLNGHFDDDAYFNNPVDYMANLTDERLLELIRRVEIFLVTSDLDIAICRERTYDLSRVLSERGIPHRLDDWGGQTVHDWPVWRRMIREYL
ncbi:MAG TPA: alpha/beta hydrolase-fold protein [Blastocatellia bacterium]|nr:alpha/beta hydrolase-fold protein [Blastocatellia bacterium]